MHIEYGIFSKRNNTYWWYYIYIQCAVHKLLCTLFISDIKNGDLGFCIDASANPNPNNTAVQPSYQFYKKQNGEVYY